MPSVAIDGADLLGGRIHGECFDGGGALRCAGAWVLDGWVLPTRVVVAGAIGVVVVLRVPTRSETAVLG